MYMGNWRFDFVHFNMPFLLIINESKVTKSDELHFKLNIEGIRKLIFMNLFEVI